MNSFQLLALLIFTAACIGSTLYLIRCLKKERQLIALVGLFSLAMGITLLTLDLVLITFTHGPQHIPDYLLFNRLVSDTGFAGRWMLTVYLFVSTGILISIYLLARNILKKFNKIRGKG